MKKNILSVVLLLVFSISIPAAEGVTNTAEASPVTATAKEKTIFDAIGGLFAPSKTKGAADIAAENEKLQESAKPAVTETALPQRLLILGDIFSSTYSIFSWISFIQSYNNYNAAYSAVNNTTFDNYNMLLISRGDVINNETSAFISTGIAAACLLYTAADVFWLHIFFPIAPGLAYMDNQQILTLNYRF